jgi:hypothetical protein
MCCRYYGYILAFSRVNISPTCVLVVSPALGESVRDLRSVQSSFISEFHQVIASMHTAHAQVFEEAEQKEGRITDMQEDVRKLQDVLAQLNQVHTLQQPITMTL